MTPFSRMNVPSLYEDARYSKIPQHCPHKEHVRTYLNNLSTMYEQGTGLYLWGDYGTGKSAISCIILKIVFAKLKKVGFWTKCANIAGDLINERMFDSNVSIRDRMLSVPFLVIDELVCFDDRRDIYVESVIRERVSDQLPTIMTSNYSPTKLKNKIPALSEVLKECALPVKVEGHNFRSDKAKEIKDMF